MGKLEERILAKTELFLSSILEMRFGDGTGQDLQVKLARKEILAFLRQELSSYRREIEKEALLDQLYRFEGVLGKYNCQHGGTKCNFQTNCHKLIRAEIDELKIKTNQ